MTQATSPTLSRNALTWFEIPVNNLDRAQAFYETVLGAPLRREAMGPAQTLAVLPYSDRAGPPRSQTHSPAWLLLARCPMRRRR